MFAIKPLDVKTEKIAKIAVENSKTVRKIQRVKLYGRDLALAQENMIKRSVKVLV